MEDSHVDRWRKSIPGTGNSKCKDSVGGQFYSLNRRRPGDWSEKTTKNSRR